MVGLLFMVDITNPFLEILKPFIISFVLSLLRNISLNIVIFQNNNVYNTWIFEVFMSKYNESFAKV